MLRSLKLAVLGLGLAAGPVSGLTFQQDLVGATGKAIGNVTIEAAVGGVLVRVFVEKNALETGWHGLHFHAVGDCSDIGKFKLSGGHVGKMKGAHGLKNPRGPEFGDMPNIYVPHQHAANAEFFVTTLDLLGGEGDPRVLLDDDGSALVIHEAMDDHVSQPIGGSGARVACADLRK